MAAHSTPSITVSPPVFLVSGGLVVAFLIFGAAFPERAGELLPALLSSVGAWLGWFYVGSVSFFLLFALALLVSPWARLRLGPDDSRPAYGTLTWFSMLFSAGMGIGLLFYGVAEPMMHFTSPPVGEGGTLAAARAALPLTFFHWGLHAWGIYALMGLAIAYFAYRRGLPLAIRSTLHPLLGERIHGWAGHLVDILAVFGTLFGLATSLGLGAMQINAGLGYLFGVGITPAAQLAIIGVITLCATISLVTGVDRGIRRLSELNVALAGLLLLFVFLVGPTVILLAAFVQNVGGYLRDIVHRSAQTGALRESSWVKDWTVFYWGWWIAWSPFVGMFIARISRGRTIRELVLGVLLVPSLVTFVWMTVFGNTAIHLELELGGLSDAVSADVSTAIFVMLDQLPLAALTSTLAALVVAVFFVTSSDSASFVVDMLTSGGHPNPPIWQRVFWAVTEGAVAAVLLWAAGEAGLKALQAGVVAVGAPFCLVLVLMAWSLARALREEGGGTPRREREGGRLLARRPDRGKGPRG